MFSTNIQHLLNSCALRVHGKAFWFVELPLLYILFRFRDTPVVKSSSRELCYIILAGICLGYLCTFSLIAKPHVIHCYLQRLGIGLSPAMSYSALVTKVRIREALCYSVHTLGLCFLALVAIWSTIQKDVNGTARSCSRAGINKTPPKSW